MTMRSGLLGAAFVVIIGGACGGSNATKKTDTTPAQNNNTAQNDNTASTANKEPAPIERDALITVRENMFPPVDVDGWVCEPKTWGENRQARIHCTAPAGSSDLITELKKMPEVVTAEPAN